nr:hypothetical protein Iba_chr10eCG7030 [Ipomoea batatas]
MSTPNRLDHQEPILCPNMECQKNLNNHQTTITNAGMKYEHGNIHKEQKQFGTMAQAWSRELVGYEYVTNVANLEAATQISRCVNVKIWACKAAMVKTLNQPLAAAACWGSSEPDTGWKKYLKQYMQNYDSYTDSSNR